MATTPIIAPDGSSWDIPSAKVPDAVKAGGKVGASVMAPDNSKWLIPLDKVRDAIAQGGQLMGTAAPDATKVQPESSLSDQAMGAVSKVGDAVAKGVKTLVSPAITASAPNIALQLVKHLRGEPNALKDIPPAAMQTFLAAGGFGEGSAAAPLAEDAAAAGTQAEAATTAKPPVTPPVGTEPSPDLAEPVRTPTGETMPRTLSGESALRRILTGQDNANLMKIAKSRGISVTAEQQLKPGVADPRLIEKIVGDFDEDELDGVRSQYLEVRNNMHQFGDIGPEAWKTMSMQTYFPDVKIAATTLKRVSKALGRTPEITLPAGQTEEDLSPLLQQSLKQARAARAAQGQP
jgi:hypothetical protein